MSWGFRKYLVCMVKNVIKWRNGQVRWVLGGSGGSVWVMGECRATLIVARAHNLSSPRVMCSQERM